MVSCLCYILEVHEEFIGYSLNLTSANSIVATVKDVLLHRYLRIENFQGQCYDGASSMSWVKSGIAARIVHRTV